MLIDISFAVLLVIAVMRGYRQGFFIGIFSLLGVIIGIAAAMKLSLVTAAWISGRVQIPAEWLPLISFLLIFIVVLLLVRLGARAIEQAVALVLPDWLNRLGGAVFFAAIYFLVFSVFLFYADKMQLLQPAIMSKSVTTPFIQPWGPKIIDGLGSVIPTFRNLFEQLTAFFDRLAKEIS